MTVFRSSFLVVAALALSAGSASAAGPRRAEPAAGGTALAYVTDYLSAAVRIFRQDGKTPVRSITIGLQEPFSAYVDASGTLYVADIKANSIVEYAQNAIQPTATLTTGISGPNDVIVGADGTVYVSEGGGNAVLEFAGGATAPTATLSVNGPGALALDGNNNLYVAYTVLSGFSFSGHVEEFPAGSTTGSDLGITVAGAGQVAIAKNGDLVLGDQTNDVINVYKPGRTVPLRSFATYPFSPFSFAFDSSGKTLFVVNGGRAADVLLYDFASGKKIRTIDKGLASTAAVAVYPPPAPGKPRDAFARPHAPTARFMHPGRAVKANVFVADTGNAVVDGFDRKTGAMVEQFTGFNQVQGVATDIAGNLYVADAGNARVLVYPPGASSPSLTLGDPGQYPIGIDISAQGDVAVTSLYALNGDPGGVAFYHAGQTTAYAATSVPFIARGFFCAYDAAGNLYMDGTDAANRAEVAEIVGGGALRKIRNLNVFGIQEPGGVAVRKNGDYVVTDEQAAALTEFRPASNRVVRIVRPAGATFPLGIALSRSEKTVWTADQGIGAAAEYGYPGGALVDSLPIAGIPITIAVVPRAQP